MAGFLACWRKFDVHPKSHTSTLNIDSFGMIKSLHFFVCFFFCLFVVVFFFFFFFFFINPYKPSVPFVGYRQAV